MIYRKNDKSENIKEIQGYLYNISHFSDTIPEVHPDGVFGNTTGNAVRAFQAEYSLPVTGEVDSSTYDTLTVVYRNLKKCHPEKINVFPGCDGFMLSEGDCNHAVYFLQIMLNELKHIFREIPETDINGVYDRKTSDAVRFMQSISRFPETGKTDKYTWNNIVRIFNHIT